MTLRPAVRSASALVADHGLCHLGADLRWIGLTAVRPGARRCADERRPRPRGVRRPRSLRPPDSLIEARDIFLSFGQTPALRSASVSVAAGEILAVMGPSGSGKSTLLHCLAGILTPDSGEVWFEGRRIDRLREADRSALRRDRFGFVFQFGQLVPELTAEENVALPLLLGGARRAPPGCGRCRCAAWPTACTSVSGCSPGAAAPPCRGSRRCGRRLSGPIRC